MAQANILLNVVGWVVASIVTLVGVFLLHRYQERSKQRHEDRVAIYEPLHRQMVRTLERGYLYKHGYVIEGFEGDFWSIVNRGALHPKRHSALREDVEHLIQLRMEAEAAQVQFRKAMEAALEEAAGEIEIQDADDNPMTLVSLFGGSFSGYELSEPLSSGDKERFLETIDGRIQGASASIPEGQESPSEALYKKARIRMRKAHEGHDEASIKILHHTKRIKARLEQAIRSGDRFME